MMVAKSKRGDGKKEYVKNQGEIVTTNIYKSYKDTISGEDVDPGSIRSDVLSAGRLDSSSLHPEIDGVFATLKRTLIAKTEAEKRIIQSQQGRVIKRPIYADELEKATNYLGGEDTLPMDAKELYDLFRQNSKEMEDRFQRSLEIVDSRRAADIEATEKRLTDAIEKLASTSEKSLSSHSVENKEWQERFKQELKDELKDSDSRNKWMIGLMIATFVGLLGVIAAIIVKL